MADAYLRSGSTWRDVISIAGTGMGKTLTFWMPLLFRPHGIQLVITPLNNLGQQNVQTLEQANIKAILISAKMVMECNFQVCWALQDIILFLVHVLAEVLQRQLSELQ